MKKTTKKSKVPGIITIREKPADTELALWVDKSTPDSVVKKFLGKNFRIMGRVKGAIAVSEKEHGTFDVLQLDRYNVISPLSPWYVIQYTKEEFEHKYDVLESD